MVRVEEFVEQHLGIFKNRVNCNIESWQELYDFAIAMASYGFQVAVDEIELQDITIRPDCWLYTLYLIFPEKMNQRQHKASERLVRRILWKRFKPSSAIQYQREDPPILKYDWN